MCNACFSLDAMLLQQKQLSQSSMETRTSMIATQVGLANFDTAASPCTNPKLIRPLGIETIAVTVDFASQLGNHPSPFRQSIVLVHCVTVCVLMVQTIAQGAITQISPLCGAKNCLPFVHQSSLSNAVQIHCVVCCIGTLLHWVGPRTIGDPKCEPQHSKCLRSWRFGLTSKQKGTEVVMCGSGLANLFKRAQQGHLKWVVCNGGVWG